MAGELLSQVQPELAGRRVLVTGAGSGVGLATAALLQGHGARVAAVVVVTSQIGLVGHARGAASAASAFITGQVVCADGGFTAR